MLRAREALRAADPATATPDEIYQAHGFGSGDFGFDPGQRFLQLQIRAIEELIGALEDADVGGAVTGPFEADHVQAFGLDLETGIREERRRVQIDARVA